MVVFSVPAAFIAVSSLLSLSTNGSPVVPAVRDAEGLTARADTFAITGVSGSVQPRLEIRTLAQDSVSWNLFLLAMDRFLNTNQNDMLSFYKVSGIHGVPFENWDGVPGAPSDWSGYCPHGSNLFGSWHRPFIALLEQVLNSHAVAIAGEFPTGTMRSAYQAAAAKLRFPYWDWATNSVNGNILPGSVSEPTVSVSFPNGTTGQIHNPLYSYRFHPHDPSIGGAPQNQWPETIRAGTTSDMASITQMGQLEVIFKSGHSAVQNSVSRIFGHYSGWSSSVNSIESVHNTIHSSFQYNSDMYSLAYSAFDPIFWLHHCNVDRLIALVQAIWPQSYVQPAQQKGSTWTIKRGSTQDVNSPLTPFHRDTKGTFWTSASVRDTKVFGYTYPELVGNPSNSSLISTVKNMYPPSSGLAASNTASTANVDGVGNTPIDYVANVTLARGALGDSYAVEFALGNPTSDATTWSLDPGFVGSVAALAVTGVQSDALSSDTVMLTQALQSAFDSGELGSANEDDVLDYMKKNLRWRVLKGNTVVPVEEVPHLKIDVLSTKVRPAKSESEFPAWVGDMTSHPDINGAE
ncbi:uncharacterized protein K452DRAFT_323045 [Aplosporella prunicola CBS 121167]|uniref:tyrosinase n=1 Tax=Aplosporella prunicola CBS 121167 TaxID=1176127 RepID=A0A6A6AXD8_9PEZI|nr:uncharacterized protein K452DRAFT_323045 [Aplosporella prunicola CBS 121167]KAF2135447.1 hypothetical protein K452DRAFT_323045 [Aplosporella prunicola CBS 121167]